MYINKYIYKYRFAYRNILFVVHMVVVSAGLSRLFGLFTFCGRHKNADEVFS